MGWLAAPARSIAGSIGIGTEGHTMQLILRNQQLQTGYAPSTRD